MNKLLRQFQKRIQRNSTVNNNEFSCLTRNSKQLTQSSARKGFTIYKGLTQIALGMLIAVTAHAHGTDVQVLSKDISCGHIISSIRIVGVIEIRTEVEKQCAAGNSETKQQKP